MNPARIVFFGTPEFAACGLRALISDPSYKVGLVVTQPDRAAGRGKKMRGSPVKAVAEEHTLPVLQSQSLKRYSSQFQEHASMYGPFDIGVVIAFGQILPQTVLDVPRLGCVNVHASLLPRWRGAAPIQRALMAGDSSTGVQLMRMEAGLDTGGVFATAETAIAIDDTAGSLHDRLATLGADLLRSNLKRIITQELPAVPQASEGLIYAEKIKNDEAAINWQASAIEIDRLIRGLSPAPGAYTHIGTKRLKILKSRVLSEVFTSAPGTAHLPTPDTLAISCGTGSLAVLEAQLEGKKPLSIEEFLRGNSIPSGIRLVTQATPR